MANIVGVFRLGRDCELRHMGNGDAVTNLALAYNYGRKDDGGNKPTQWLEGALYGARAEALAPYLLKGTAIYAVIQEPHIETYPKNDGSQGFKLVGKIGDIEFAGSAPQHGQQNQGQQRQQRNDDYSPAPSKDKPKPSFDDIDSDIPF